MRKLLLSAVVLLLLTNVVVLAGVAYNRAGEPVVSLELTERELTMVQSYRRTDENSGTALSLQWQVSGDGEQLASLYAGGSSPEWLDEAKLSALGFDLAALKRDKEQDRRRWRSLAREVVIVLEYDAEAYQQSLSLVGHQLSLHREKLAQSPDDDNLAERLKHTEERLAGLKLSATRLFAVDAGLEQQALIEKYADSDRYLFVRGDIGPRWDDDAVTGRIQRLTVQQVHVPLPYSQQLAELTQGQRFNAYNEDPIPPRYRVRLNIGKRLEPWVAAVVPIGEGNQDQ